MVLCAHVKSNVAVCVLSVRGAVLCLPVWGVRGRKMSIITQQFLCLVSINIYNVQNNTEKLEKHEENRQNIWRKKKFAIPVVGDSGAGGGLSGFLPRHYYSMTAEQIVDNPVPRPGGAGGLQRLHHGQSSTAFSEQIAEFPDPGGGLPRFSASPGLRSVFFSLSWTSPEEKKCEDPAHPVVGTGCGVELMDAVSLTGVCTVAQHRVRRFLLVAERQEWCFLVCSSGLPSYPVAWSSRWCRLRGCCALSAYGSFWMISSSASCRCSRCSHLEIWTSRPLPIWCLGVTCGVRRIGSSGRMRCLVQQWIHFLGGFGRISLILRYGELES